MIKLGDKVRDNLTGFKGVVIARAEYLNGCVSLQVQPTVLEDGKIMSAAWIDEQRLTDASKARVGGPQSHPPDLHP